MTSDRLLNGGMKHLLLWYNGLVGFLARKKLEAAS